MRLLTGIALVLVHPLAGQERLSYIELELAGACEGVRLDCGAEGATELHGPFSAGEDRRLVVPVPVRSPTRPEELELWPLPQAHARPPGAPARVRVLGWHAPTRELGPTAPPPALPVSSVPARPRLPELALALLAPFFLGRMRRSWVQLCACAALALLVFALARSRSGDHPLTHLVQWEAAGDGADAWTAAYGRLPLPKDALRVEPSGAPVEIELEATTGQGWVWAPHATLLGRERVTAPLLDARQNGGESLREAWTRSSGRWRWHGAWPARDALPAPLDAAVDPPGWLVAGLPAAGGALVGRTESGVWLRCAGFESP